MGFLAVTRATGEYWLYWRRALQVCRERLVGETFRHEARTTEITTPTSKLLELLTSDFMASPSIGK